MLCNGKDVAEASNAEPCTSVYSVDIFFEEPG